LDAGQFVESAHWYELAIASSDDEELAREATLSAYEHSQLSSAIRCAQHWLAINPTSQEAHEVTALAALRLYQVDTAVNHLDVLLGSAYISPASGFLQLLPKVEVLDASAALAIMKKLAEKYPEVAEAHYVVAKLASQTANQPLMLSEAQRAHELAPYWSPAGITLARAQLAGGQVEQAVLTAQSVANDDHRVSVRSEYAEILIEAGKVNEGIQLLKELEKEPGDVDAAVLLLAQLDVQAGEYQAAFDRYSRLMNGGAHTSEAILGMAQISERAGATDSARQLYSRVQDGESVLPAQIRLAQLIQQQDGIDAALASLKQFGEGNPDKYLDMVRARAELLIAKGDGKKAMELYDQSIVNFPDEASLKLVRAFLLVKLDKINPAVNAMNELLNDRQEDPVVLNALGYTLIDGTSDVRKGYGYVQKALQYSPDNGAVLDSMGWAEFKLGHPQVALDYLQRAVKRTVDADLDFHLGEVLWSLKRYDDAIQAWQVGLQHAPKHAEILKRMKMAEKQHKIPVKPATRSN
ncbi:MAG: tetratricopeptide repeat protein, partial [Steroidobacter sp.]